MKIKRNKKGQFLKGAKPMNGFKKGQIAWNRGVPFSEETRKRMSKSRMGKEPWNKGSKSYNVGEKNHFYGKTHSEEARIKIREARAKQIFSLKTRAIWSKNRKGRKWTLEQRERRSLNALRGEKAPAWKGGVTPIHRSIRMSLKYRLWRKRVFERDNYTCQFCGVRNGNRKAVYLEADHIKSFSKYPELRFTLSNGRVLCKKCHKKTDNYAGKSNRKIA